FTLAAEESGIEFGGEQRVLKALHRPVEDGDDHFRIGVFAQLAAIHTEANEADGAIRIFGDKEAIDLALQDKVCAVAAEERDTVSIPIFVQYVFRPSEPITHNLEESLLANFRGSIEIFRKRTNGALVDLEEESVFAAEVLKDGALGDAERRGD